MMLETLRQKNPGIPFYSVNDPIFKKYGKVLTIDLSDLADAVAALPMPESGSAYSPSIDSLEACPSAKEVTRVIYGEMAAQSGCCWGYNSQMNALEWHHGSEINLAVGEPLVLLLATIFDLEEDKLDANKVVGFLLEPGTPIEVYGTTLHYCPCQVNDNGFKCLVCLPKDTNTELKLPHEDKRLTANNKWLLAHENCESLIADGAQVGIYGENWIVNY